MVKISTQIMSSDISDVYLIIDLIVIMQEFLDPFDLAIIEKRLVLGMNLGFMLCFNSCISTFNINPKHVEVLNYS